MGRTPTVFALVALAGLVSPTVTMASPLEDPALNGGILFAGPTRPHGTSILLNPAALGLAGLGYHVTVVATARLSQLWIDRSTVAENGQFMAGDSVSDLNLVPAGFVSFDASLSEVFRVGIAVSTPIAQRFPSGHEALRYHTLGGHLYQFQGTLAASARLADRFHLGIGLSLGYTSFDLDIARDTAMAAGSDTIRGTSSDCLGQRCGLENPAASQTLRFRTATGLLGGLFAGKNIGLTLGMLQRIKDNWWLAASLVSMPGAATLGGDLDLPGTVTVTAAERDGGGQVSGRAEALFRTSQAFTVGGRGPVLPNFDAVLTIRWVNWSRHRDLDLRAFGGDLESAQGGVERVETRFRGLRDTFTIDAGLESSTPTALRYGGRLRMNTGAVNARSITPMQPDGFNVTALLGGDLRLGNSVVLGATYGFTYYPPVTTGPDSEFSPLDRLACVDQEFAFDACGPFRDGRALPTAAGNYDRIQHQLVLTLQFDSL